MTRLDELGRRLRGGLRLHRALRLIWESTPRLTLVAVPLAILQSVLPLVALYMMKLVVDAVAAGATGGGPPPRVVFLLIGVAVAAGFLTSVVSSVAGYVARAQSQTVTDHVQDVLHAKSIELDLAFYESPEYFDTLHRAQREAPDRPTRILAGLNQVAQALVTGIGIIGLLATVAPSLVGLLFLAVLPGLWVRMATAHRIDRWQRRRAATERRVRYLDRLIVDGSHAKELRIFGLGPLLSRRFHDLMQVLREERLAIEWWRRRADVAMSATVAIALFLSLIVIARQTLAGFLSVGDLVMFFGVVQRGQAALGQLAGGLSGLYEDNLFLAAADEILTLEPSIQAPREPRPVPRPFRRGLRFQGVDFDYPLATRSGLRGIDLHVGPGEVVALVGANGSGKTTIMKLMCRLYDPNAGSITLDDVDYRQLDPGDLRRQIAVISQDFPRYQMSVRDNIWFGGVHLPCDERAIRRAAEAAGAARLIDRLPRGYDAILGRWFGDGEELSTGEWQRIALARAFASDAQIIVLDEPTSSIDARAEAELFAGLKAALAGRAAVLISHRYSSVRIADRIYVLEDGRITEHGGHEELVARGGEYANLFALQSSPGGRRPRGADDPPDRSPSSDGVGTMNQSEACSIYTAT